MHHATRLRRRRRYERSSALLGLSVDAMNIRANKLLCSGESRTLLLLVAAFRENYWREWRRVQRAYRAELPAQQAADFDVQLRQVVRAGAARDRSLHQLPRRHGAGRDRDQGQADVRQSSRRRPRSAAVRLRRVPRRPGARHGQGRCARRRRRTGRSRCCRSATPTPAAAAATRTSRCPTSTRWHAAARCSSATTASPATASTSAAARCVRVARRASTAPDLSRVGGTGFDRAVVREASRASRRGAGRAVADSLRRDPAGRSRGASNVFLSSRVGAPGLVEAKALFHSLGCRGCHKIGGVGGDDGPDLTREGEKDPRRLDYTHVPGEQDVGELAGRALPRAGAGRARLADAGARAQRAQIDALTFYLLSLRRSDYPGGLLAEGPHPRRALRASASSPPTARRSSAPSAPPATGRTAKACAIPGMRRVPGHRQPRLPRGRVRSLPRRHRARTAARAGACRRGARRKAACGRRRSTPSSRTCARSATASRRRAETEPRRWVKGDAEGGRAAVCRHLRRRVTARTAKARKGRRCTTRCCCANATDRYLVETIRRGRRGTSMPSFGAAVDGAPTALRRARSNRIVTFIRTWEGAS